MRWRRRRLAKRRRAETRRWIALPPWAREAIDEIVDAGVRGILRQLLGPDAVAEPSPLRAAYPVWSFTEELRRIRETADARYDDRPDAEVDW